MEKEQIISTLTQKLGTTQLSSRTIATYVENNLLGENEEYNDAYYDKHVNILKSLQGQFSADVANQVNTFKADWEKAHKPNVAEPETNAKNSNDTLQKTEGNSNDETLKKMLVRMEALEKALKDEQSKTAQQGVRNAIKAKSEELKVANKYLWDKIANEASITDNMDAEQLLNKVKNAYETELRNIIGIGATPYGNGSTPSPQESQKALDDYFASKKAQGKF